MDKTIESILPILKRQLNDKTCIDFGYKVIVPLDLIHDQLLTINISIDNEILKEYIEIIEQIQQEFKQKGAI